jgi:hypothetical protein
MAPQAQAALFVERQGCNVVRVIARRTVTVFALNSFVRRTPMFLYIVLMTLETRLIALILDWKSSGTRNCLANKISPTSAIASHNGCKTCRFTFTCPCAAWHSKG